MKTKIGFNVVMLLLLSFILVIQQSCEKDSIIDEDDGTFTDPRDGQTYKIATIGSQTWFTQNLNYKTGESRCYDNKQSNCNKLGRLYYWKTAKDACPDGWHLPSHTEWATLESYLGMSNPDKMGYVETDIWKKLKATSGWHSYNNGNNSSGFTALPGGEYWNLASSQEFWGIDHLATWWMSTECPNDPVWEAERFVLTGFKGVLKTYETKAEGCSVRCLKD